MLFGESSIVWGVLANFGYEKSLSGQPAEGLSYLQRSLRLRPRGGFIKGEIGDTYVMLGDHEAAIPWLLQAIQDQPKFPDTYAWLAMACELKGDKEQVKAALAQLHRVAPGFRAKDMDRPGATCSQVEKDFWDTHVGAVAQRAGIPP